MPAVHNIDHDRKLILTVWEGEPTIKELSTALKDYQNNIKADPDLFNYDELVDFSNITGFRLKSGGLRILADSAASSDRGIVKTKMALVVKSGFTYGLARMYEIYRNLNPMRSKKIGVFRNKYYALEWLEKPHSP